MVFIINVKELVEKYRGESGGTEKFILIVSEIRFAFEIFSLKCIKFPE